MYTNFFLVCFILCFLLLCTVMEILCFALRSAPALNSLNCSLLDVQMNVERFRLFFMLLLLFLLSSSSSPLSFFFSSLNAKNLHILSSISLLSATFHVDGVLLHRENNYNNCVYFHFVVVFCLPVSFVLSIQSISSFLRNALCLLHSPTHGCGRCLLISIL